MDKTIIKPFEQIEYKVYGYTLPEVPSHDGYVKIGDTTRDAATRIFEQVGTAGLNPNILFEKLARKSDGKWFRDKELHRYLLLNGVKRKDFNSKADEWFYFNGTLERAEELTEKFIHNDYEKVQIVDGNYDYILRSEQQTAVEKTLEYYLGIENEKEFLWNAKPRFGKTLTTYDFIRNLQTTNVLIVTNRPAIANSWFDDFQKFIAWQEPHMKFVSETDALRDKAMTRRQYLEYLDSTSYEKPSQVAFISLQDLKGAKFAGGIHDKLEWVAGLNWDVLVIDEAHEGIDTIKTDRAFSQIKRNFTLHLSGTPFKALANNKFHEDQIFNWSYVDEQEAKENWDETVGSNPYETLPTLNLFTYQMSKMIEDEVTAGMQIADEKNIDYAFDLNEFFRVKDNGQFEYEENVIKFLDNLSSGKFPFSENQYRKELNHTFWLLPRVNAAKALEKLLKTHPTFKDYEVVLAAGDGVSIHEDLEDEALDMKKNTKSFDKVREAIKKHDKTITLSVGQLTTGVTIPEWTAVFMLNNIESPSLYFQAAFRSQNPYEFEHEGKLFRKENAYIFDFSPDRTLRLYDEFANNLTNGSSKTSTERKKKIKKLLNFFPVIAEDEEGKMHEINASEVLTIPTRITSKEVVKRGFMCNLLFANISGIFSGDSPFKEILDKIPPEKNKRLGKNKSVEVTKPHLNDEGEIEVPEEVVLGKSKDLFGEKIYEQVDGFNDVVQSIDKEKEEQKKAIKTFAGRITDSFVSGFEELGKSFNLNKGQQNNLEKSVKNSLEDVISNKHLDMANEIREIESEYELKITKLIVENKKDEEQILKSQLEKKRKEIENIFVKEVNEEVKETIQTVVKEQIEKEEEKKKKTTEDDVRDHLRGFARTIPAFLMAYGDESTTLDNFDENIDEETFEDLTSITIEEFKKLRDGFTFVDNKGKEKTIPGLFNEVVFNASIQEFLDTKERLSNYFDENLEEDIFDYIPPQKTNQIFTPKRIVKLMIDKLEEDNPNIFKDKTKKFADLYAKSGLYITEIIKKLNIGLKEVIPKEEDRIKWILENQVYISTPNNIIYNIVRNFVYSNFQGDLSENLVEVDVLEIMNEDNVSEIQKIFGDEKVKFDVIIGNPPYQENDNGKREHGAGKNASASPVYDKFILSSMKISDIQSFIIPTRWAFGAGKGLKQFSETMLNDKHIQSFVYYQNSKHVFPDNDIKGGVSYYTRNTAFQGKANITVHLSNGGIINRNDYLNTANTGRFIVYSELGSIIEKVLNKNMNFKSIMGITSTRNPYGLKTDLYRNPKKNGISQLYNERISQDDIKVLGLDSSQKRVYKYISRSEKLMNGLNEIDTWKVFSPYAYGNGEFGEKIPQPIIGQPGDIVTETFLRFGSFDNKFEAESLTKYMRTKFFRALVSILKVTQHSTTTYQLVPLQDFTNTSEIDWTKSISEIDKQLYIKYNLTKDEIEFIENNVFES